MSSYPASTAVMARRVEPADSLDFFPTPPWASRALPEHVLPHLFQPLRPDLFAGGALDPACGQGHMALALADYFDRVEASDIFDYGFGRVMDFLHPDTSWRPASWIITNPPFNLGAEFVAQALRLARVGVAMLVRTQFLEGAGRYGALFKRRPPQIIAQFVERAPMHKGRWSINGKTATAYAWLVWAVEPQHDQLGQPPKFLWIPPCRAALSKHDDWLKFGGCMDLPKTHPAIRLQDEKDFALPPTPATLGDVAAQLQGMLI